MELLGSRDLDGSVVEPHDVRIFGPYMRSAADKLLYGGRGGILLGF